MPFYYNFSDLKEIKNVEIFPDGWINPLTIEYGLDDINYYWRVKSTKHTFSIPIQRMNYITSGNYVKHFEEVLENFREEYIEWKNTGFIAEWMGEYREEYKRFII